MTPQEAINGDCKSDVFSHNDLSAGIISITKHLILRIKPIGYCRYRWAFCAWKGGRTFVNLKTLLVVSNPTIIRRSTGFFDKNGILLFDCDVVVHTDESGNNTFYMVDFQEGTPYLVRKKNKCIYDCQRRWEIRIPLSKNANSVKFVATYYDEYNFVQEHIMLNTTY